MTEYHFQTVGGQWLTVDVSDTDKIAKNVETVISLLKDGLVTMIVITGNEFDPFKSVSDVFSDRHMVAIKNHIDRSEIKKVEIVFMNKFPVYDHDQAKYYTEKLKKIFSAFKYDISMIGGPYTGDWFEKAVVERDTIPHAPPPVNIKPFKLPGEAYTFIPMFASTDEDAINILKSSKSLGSESAESKKNRVIDFRAGQGRVAEFKRI